MNNKKIGKSLRNYIYKEGYTKSSFCKMLGMDYNVLNLIIDDKFINEAEYNEILAKILDKINLNKEDLIKDYYDKDIREEQISIVKNNKNNIFKLDIEQREILVNLLEDEIAKKEAKKRDYKLSEEKQWRVDDLNDEIKKIENIINVLKNIIVIS